MRTSRKIKRERIPPVVKLMRSMDLPQSQIDRGDMVICDIVDFSSADSRKTQRSGERQTVRRTTKIDELKNRNVLTAHEALVCEWYKNMHSARYDTVGITAQLGGTGGGAGKRDHLPSTSEQEQAFYLFDFARQGITPQVRLTFERVVLEDWPIGRMGLIFRLALNQLVNRIEGKVELSA